MESTHSLALATVPIPAMFGLSDRNTRAEKVIVDYAAGHAKADIAIGLAGLVIPGGATAALLASVAAQAPLVYMPMSAKLADIYCAQTDATSGRVVFAGALVGGGLDIATALGMDFLSEIAGDIVQEAGIAIGISVIPIVGAVVGACLDAAIAATMTWRVGTMVSIYFQNGGEWVGSRKNTYDLAREMVGALSAKNVNRINLDSIPDQVPDVNRRMVAYAVDLVSTMMEAGAHLSVIRPALLKKGIPIWIIDTAMAAVA